MNRLRWPSLVRAGEPASPGARLAVAGGVAWSLAIVLWALWIPAERRQLDALREANASSAALAARRAASPAATTARASPGERFLAAFPALDTQPQRAESLLLAATQHKLAWQRSDFHASRDAVPGLVRYQITLPLSGSYGSIRSLVDEALRADPALVLERLQLRRSTAAAAQIEAASVWSLYTRDAAGTPRPASPVAKGTR